MNTTLKRQYLNQVAKQEQAKLPACQLHLEAWQALKAGRKDAVTKAMLKEAYKLAMDDRYYSLAGLVAWDLEQHFGLDLLELKCWYVLAKS